MNEKLCTFLDILDGTPGGHEGTVILEDFNDRITELGAMVPNVVYNLDGRDS